MKSRVTIVKLTAEREIEALHKMTEEVRPLEPGQKSTIERAVGKRKRLIVTGAENSGTGLVTQLLRTIDGVEVIHCAIPHVSDQTTDWEPLYSLPSADAVIFVARHHPAQERSQKLRSGRGESTAYDAFGHVYRYCSLTGAALFVWTYEAIVHEFPESFMQAAWDLGLNPDYDKVYKIDVRDENWKHYGS